MNYRKQKFLLLNGLSNELLKVLRENKAVIAGGAVRAVFAEEHISDYDIYVPSTESLNDIKKYLDDKFDEHITTENAISYYNNHDSLKIQLIKLPSVIGLSNQELLDQFDFTICMGLYDVAEDKFLLAERFLQDTCARELVFNISAKYPIASLFRTKKYMKRGYKISGVEIIKLGLAIHNLKLETYRDLKEQLMGIDTLFLKELTDTLLTPEYAEKKFDFNEFLTMLDEYDLTKFENNI